MADSDADVEQTLHVARSISVYRIPPRPGSHGWRSGEWLVSDKLFSGRLRLVARGEVCEIRLEDPHSGDLFAVCPVQYGQRNLCVEPVTDSSRYYVLRVEDSATRRHAFLGMGFDNRNDAFDFNEALVRHEQHVARERATVARAAAMGPGPSSNSPAASSFTSCVSAGTAAPPSTSATGVAPGQKYWSLSSAAANISAAAEVEGLYRQTAGLRLQEGQTIRVNVNGLKKPGASSGAAAGGSFLSGLSPAQPQVRAAFPLSQAASGAAILPPPPALPGQQPSALQQPEDDLGRLQTQQNVLQGADDRTYGTGYMLGQDSVMAVGVLPAACDTTAASGQENWATFD